MKKIIIALLTLTCALSICVIASSTNKQKEIQASSAFSLTLETFGGTNYNIVETNGEQGVRLPTPYKYGCTFLGWYLNSEYVGSAISESYYIPTGNDTLYARWSNPNYPIVSFDSNGGTEYLDLTFTGITIKLPTPTKLDYTFGGWYETEDFTSTKLGETYIPTATITLYAKWVEVDYPEVTFVSNGGTTYNVTTSNSVGINLPTPVKEGFTFDGWFTDSACAGTSLSGVYIPTQNVTLYAGWTELTSYTVTLNANGGLTASSITGYEGDIVELPTPTYYGYRFDGWFTDSACSGTALDTTYTLTSTTTLFAKWTEVNYLYLYYNYLNEYDRLEYAPNTTLITSELPIPEDYIVGGVACPFVRWTNEDGTALYNSITLSSDVVLLAEYDLSKAPYKKYLTDNGNGSYTTTTAGKQIWGFKYTESLSGTYSATIKMTKGSGGAPGIVFRLTHSRKNYAFEDGGTSYISATISPSTGSLQMGKVVSGNWSVLSSVALTSLPNAWQTKYASNSVITVTLKVESYGDGFKIYVDNALAYTHTDATTISDVLGSGWGIRNTVLDNTVTFSNITYTKDVPYTTKFTNSNGTYTNSATSIYKLQDLSSNIVTYSATISFYTDNGGGIGLAWRMKYDGTTSSPYENGVYYLAAVLCPANGNLQVSKTESSKSKFAHLTSTKTSIPLADLKDATYKTAYTNGGKVSATLKVIDYGTYFEVYINNTLEFTYSDEAVLARMQGTGVGFRSSSKATTTGTPSISNVSVTESVNAQAVTTNVVEQSSAIALTKVEQVVLPKKEVIV